MKTCLRLIMIIILVCFSAIAWGQGDIKKGQEVYLAYGCAVCHGKDGRGDGLSATTFDPRPTDLHDQKKYRYGFAAGDVIYSIKHGAGEPGHGMPGFKYLTNKELEDIAAYVVSLQAK